MNENRADIELLISELQSDLAALSELEATNRKAQARLDAGADDELDFALPDDPVDRGDSPCGARQTDCR